jgi:hypothetical protein
LANLTHNIDLKLLPAAPRGFGSKAVKPEVIKLEAKSTPDFHQFLRIHVTKMSREVAI